MRIFCCRGRETGNLLPNNRRQRRTCYALCHILYPVSAAHTSIFRMDSNSTSYLLSWYLLLGQGRAFQCSRVLEHSDLGRLKEVLEFNAKPAGSGRTFHHLDVLQTTWHPCLSLPSMDQGLARSFSLFFSLSRSRPFSLSLPLSLVLSPPLSLSLILSPSLALSLYHSLSLSVFLLMVAIGRTCERHGTRLSNHGMDSAMDKHETGSHSRNDRQIESANSAGSRFL